MPTMTSQNAPYTTEFFATYADDSYGSAKVLLSVVEDLIHPRQVVDVGCGVGTWLRAWKELGASDVLGVDGDYVDRAKLQIAEDNFIPMDLTQPLPVPGAPFDLAQSLEVAEHLPEEAAEGFVSFLCSLAPVVLFSAAIPDQGGTFHVNEQWPEYWAKLFQRHRYLVFDVIRPRVWDSPQVAYWYAQNALLFVNEAHLGNYPMLHFGDASCNPDALARVHPRKWQQQVHQVPKFEDLVAAMPQSAWLLARRVGRRVQRAVGGRA